MSARNSKKKGRTPVFLTPKQEGLFLTLYDHMPLPARREHPLDMRVRVALFSRSNMDGGAQSRANMAYPVKLKRGLELNGMKVQLYQVG